MPQHERNSHIRVAHPRADPPDPTDAPYAVERLAVLAHELGNLLDGSIRCLGLARRSIEASGLAELHAVAARRQIDTAQVALERMAEMVKAAMAGAGSILGSPLLGPERSITLGDAITHAAEVMAPLGAEHQVRIATQIAPDAAPVPAGPIYPVIVNALRNAVTAIATVGGRGEILVRVSTIGEMAASIRVEVLDDGPGPPPESENGNRGIGLAIAREVARDLRGHITLARRTERADSRRPGAALILTYPAPGRTA